MQEIIKSPFTALLVAIYGLTIPYISTKLNRYVVIGLFALVALYVVSFSYTIISEWVKRKRWKEQLRYKIVYNECKFDWQISKEGDFFGRFMYSIENISDSQIHALPIEDIGWHKLPKSINFKSELKNLGNTNYRLEESRGNFYETFFDWGGSKNNHFMVFWYDIVHPPLQPKDKILITKITYGDATEKQAFEDKGALAGIPINVPMKKAEIKYLAPPGYKFDMIDHILVYDISGIRQAQIENLTNSPLISPEGDKIEWVLDKPKVGYRYNFRYKISKHE